LVFDGKSAVKVAAAAKLTGDSAFSISVWFKAQNIPMHPGLTGSRSATSVIASQLSRSPALPRSGGTPDAETAPAKEIQRGWMIDLDQGVPALKLFSDDGKLMRALALRNARLPQDTWTHLTFTYDGSRKEDGLSIYVNGTEAPLLLGSNGTAPTFKGSIADFQIFNRALTEDEVALARAWPEVSALSENMPERLSTSQREALRLYYLSTSDNRYQSAVDDLRRVSAELKSIGNRSITAMVTEERPNMRATARLLFRGMYDQPREEVEANVPSALPPMHASLPRNRLGLAQWLVDPSNPLTARVAVNRFWQEIFGTGIVKTAGDFGSQGEAPSHPELLDRLATDFRDSGWDVKRLFRLIVTSATYRQAAIGSSDKVTRDPDNRLLSRGPSFRIDGEMLRDMALSTSGLLITRLGGQPVMPYQPAGIWEATSMPASNTKHYYTRIYVLLASGHCRSVEE
jgi:hypothetical protein